MKKTFNTNLTTKELSQKMYPGLCLGNTFESFSSQEICNEGIEIATAWNNPKVNLNIFKSIAQKFNSVRLSVTWHNHLDNDLNIDPIWMQNVHKVVEAAINEGLYVILDTHHDNNLFNLSNAIKSKEDYNKILNIFLKIWEQISEEFKDYDEHLLFEDLNEPRSEGSEKEWTGGTPLESETLHKYHEAFLDFIRNSGGNNKYRFLVVPTYAASSSPDAIKNFIFPNDERTFISIHAYIPYDIALNTVGRSNFTETDKKDIKYFFEMLKEDILDKGHYIILGETGCMNKNNLEDRIEWTNTYFYYCKKYDIPVFWFDNGVEENMNEPFGNLDRFTLEYNYPQILNAILNPQLN